MGMSKKHDKIYISVLKALAKSLRPVGMVHFLQQYDTDDTGSGNYTLKRGHWLGETTVRQLAEEIKRSLTERDVESARK